MSFIARMGVFMSDDFSNILNNFKNSNNSSNSENSPSSDASNGISSETIQNLINMFKNNSDNSSKDSNSSDNSNNSVSPEMIQNFMNMLNNNSKSSNESSSKTNIDFETIMKMKSIMEKMNSKDDPRANLLLSLKPYLKNSRKSKVEQYIQLFNMSKVLDVFGGDKKK